MRVLPWNQSERGQQNTGGIPLATSKKESRGCAWFICSWCASTGPDSLSSSSSSSSSKVEAAPPSNCQGDGSSMARLGSSLVPASTGDGVANGDLKVSLKSSLKKPCGSSGMENTRSPNRANAGVEQGISNFNCNRKRKVQWTDAHGKELAQVKEFELRMGMAEWICSGRTLLVQLTYARHRALLCYKDAPFLNHVDLMKKRMTKPTKGVHVLYNDLTPSDFCKKFQVSKGFLRETFISAMVN